MPLTGVPRVFNLRFPGQYYDAETGLHYNYFRDYEPATGRYIESDPLGLLAGVSTYAYVFNNSLRGIDPTGLSESELFLSMQQQMTIPENLHCGHFIARQEMATIGKEFDKGCANVTKSATCYTRCLVKEFMGEDAVDFIWNAHKSVMIKALEKTAKQFATKNVERWVPLIGWADTAWDFSKTIYCTTNCVLE